MQNNYVVLILLAGSLLLVIFGFFLVFFIVYMRDRKNKFYIEKQQLLFDNQHGQLAEAERIQNEIGKAIHDNVLQVASLMRMNIHSISTWTQNKEQVAVVEYLKKLTDRIIDDARKICLSLNNDYNQTFNLPLTLQLEMERIFEPANIDYNLEVKGDERSLSAKLKGTIYKIAMEAILNILKHAGASEVFILCDFRTEVFFMSITDDGQGFGNEKLHAKETIGLPYMQQRAVFLKGELKIDSKPGAGCAITLTCPY